MIVFSLQIIQKIPRCKFFFDERGEFTPGKIQRFAVRYLGRNPLNLNPTQLSSLNFLSSLVNELVIVLWTLAALFLLAQWQADRDALRDAVNETSRLPVVTAVIREENAALGRNLDNPLVNPSNFRVIGDRGLSENLLGRELTAPSSPEEPLVWRLLIIDIWRSNGDSNFRWRRRTPRPRCFFGWGITRHDNDWLILMLCCPLRSPLRDSNDLIPICFDFATDETSKYKTYDFRCVAGI